MGLKEKLFRDDTVLLDTYRVSWVSVWWEMSERMGQSWALRRYSYVSQNYSEKYEAGRVS